MLNVEASHAYPRFDRFLDKVVRVLRPGGHFLYVDFRGYLEYDKWDAALAALPLRMESKREINPDCYAGSTTTRSATSNWSTGGCRCFCTPSESCSPARRAR